MCYRQIWGKKVHVYEQSIEALRKLNFTSLCCIWLPRETESTRSEDQSIYADVDGVCT